MILRSGWAQVGDFRGAPVRVHWTLPIGAFVLTGAGWVPGAWLGFAILILLHELGHALIVRAFRFHVVGIDVHGMGGECRWVGNATERQRAAIAWGGVLAQLAVFLTTPLWSARLPQPLSPFVLDLVSAFTATNLILMLVNLIPIAPLDGALAWRLFRVGDLGAWRKNAALRAKARAIQRQLDELGKDREAGGGKPSGGKVIPFRPRDPRRPPPDPH
jgi:stage IV sporulation protein FB